MTRPLSHDLCDLIGRTIIKIAKMIEAEGDINRKVQLQRYVAQVQAVAGIDDEQLCKAEIERIRKDAGLKAIDYF